MHKKIAFGVGLFIAVTPILVSAQSNDNSSLFAALENLIVQLEQTLAQLVAAKNSGTVAPTSSTFSIPGIIALTVGASSTYVYPSGVSLILTLNAVSSNSATLNATEPCSPQAGSTCLGLTHTQTIAL